MLIIFDLDDTLFLRLPDDYTGEDLNSIKLYSGARKLLARNDCKKILVSKGDPDFQYKKLAVLNLTDLFDQIFICSTSAEKQKIFKQISLDFPNEPTWVIGDRIDSEIRYGKELGFKTILLNRGKYKDLKAKDNLEIADFKFSNFKEIAQFFEEKVFEKNKSYNNKMKVVILAAGKGTRMLPLTETIPKVLVKVNGKPFLSYVIQNLKKAGFTELGIVVGYKKEKIAEFLTKNNIKATLIEQKEQKGTGDALMQAKSFCGKENFISIGGDNLCSVTDFKAIAIDDNKIYVAGIHSEEPKKYGVLIADKNNNLIEIKEKPKKFVGDIINTALYKFTPKIFEALQQIKESERKEYELPDALTLLAKQGKVKVVEVKDYWLDLGCKEDIPKAEVFLKRLGL